MNTAPTNADKLKEFKAKFTKEFIISVFTSVAKAIQFYEMQLQGIKNDQKEALRAFSKDKVFSPVILLMITQNERLKHLQSTFQFQILEQLKADAEFLQMQIDHLKTIK